MVEFDRFSEKVEVRKQLKNKLRAAFPIFAISAFVPNAILSIGNSFIPAKPIPSTIPPADSGKVIVESLTRSSYLDPTVPFYAKIILLICAVAALIFTAAFGLGSSYANLKYTRGEEDLKVANVTKGLSSKYFSKTISLTILMVIKVFLWTLLFVVPGIIALIRYSQAYYVLIDNPDIKANDAIKQSSELMKSRKWEFFKLVLSFIPWMLLGVLTLGILLIIFVMPYYNLAMARYYAVITSGKSEVVEEGQVTEIKPLEEK